jgi:hypothetical protein
MKKMLIEILWQLMIFALLVAWQLFGYTQVVNIFWVLAGILLLVAAGYFICYFIVNLNLDLILDEDMNKDQKEMAFNYIEKKQNKTFINLPIAEINAWYYYIDDIVLIIVSAWSGHVFLSLTWFIVKMVGRMITGCKIELKEKDKQVRNKITGFNENELERMLRF